MNPKVSVIIPYVEDRGFLNEAIESVKNQTYDGIIQVVLAQGKGSQGENVNKGLKIANGDYIKILHDDDTLPPRAIELSVKALMTGKHDFIHGNALVGNKGKPMYIPEVKNPYMIELLKNNVIHGGTTMYKREVLMNNKYDESLWTGEEYELHLRMLSKGYKIGYVDAFLTMYRRHEGQKSIGKTDSEYQMRRTEAINNIKNRFK